MSEPKPQPVIDTIHINGRLYRIVRSVMATGVYTDSKGVQREYQFVAETVVPV